MGRGVYISDVFMGFRKFPHFIIAIMRREGNRTWVLRATIDTVIFEAMTKAAQVGRKGDAFIVNQHDVLQTRPRSGGELLSTAGPFSSHPMSQETCVKNAMIQEEECLVGMAWLKNKRWMLVVTEDPGEELIPLRNARYLVIGLGFLGVIIIVTGTVLVARAMIAELMRIDHEKATIDATLMQSSKMAALGKLAAGIAHEVNNPLATIKEKAGWMRDLLGDEDIANSPSFQEFKKSIDKIELHVERARKVVHRFLGFARRMEPVNELVDVNVTMDETITLLENEARHRNIDIQTNFDENMPRIVSDSAQLQQVFLNIVNNAIDAIGKNSEITVETHYKPQKKEVVVKISDNGPGIPNEVLTKIFDPFFSTKGSTGTGLGLSICKTIVEAHGGAIECESIPGEFARFTLRLPLS